MSSCVRMFYNGDVKTDRNGARLPAQQDHQPASSEVSCPVQDSEG